MNIVDMVEQEADKATEQVVETLLIDVFAKGLVHAKYNLNETSTAMTESMKELDINADPDNDVLGDMVSRTQKSIEKALLKKVKSMVGADKFKTIIELSEKYNNAVSEGEANAD